jgi:copper transport protein
MTLRRGLLLALATIATVSSFGLARADPAAAHAVVTNSTPTDGQILAAPPSEVQIQFSERVSVDVGGLTVLNADGDRVDNDDSSVGATGQVLQATVKPDQPDGTYVMNYRVISADGHPVAGSIVFGVGVQTVVDTAGVSTLQAGDDPGFEFAAGVARFVMYVGALLAAGLAVFVTFVHDQRPDRWTLTPIVRIAAVTAGIGAVATVAIQAALLTGDGFSAMTDVTTLRDALTEGLDWATVIVLLGLAMVHLSTDTAKPVVAQSLAFYGGLAVAVSFALWGHSTTAEPQWLTFLADFVHVATAAVWFGGLVGLAVTMWRRQREAVVAAPEPAVVSVSAATTDGSGVMRPSTPPPASGDDPDDDELGVVASTAAMVSRFSNLAALMLFLLLVGGLTLAWKEVGSLDALFSSDYGRLLLIKIGLVGLIMLGAAYNRWRLVPQVEQAEETPTLEGSAWRHLNRAVLAEVVGIVLVLGVTSVLVNITPPKDSDVAGATTAVQRAPVRDTTVEVQLVPATVGNNAVHITYFDNANRPKDIAQAVTVEMTEPKKGIGPIERSATKAATGHYIVDGLQIPTPGDWEMKLVTRISDFEQEDTVLAFKVTS